MKKIQLLALATIIFTTSVGFTESLNIQQIPADAQWVMHIDFDTLRASEFGHLALAKIQAKHADKLNAAKQLFGSDLTEDIYSMTLHGPDNNEANAAAVFHGKFDKDKLLSMLILNKDYSKSEYNGYTLHHWLGDKKQKNQVGAFARENLIVIAETTDAVAVTLDAIDGKTDTLAQHPESDLTRMCQKAENAIVIAAATELQNLTKKKKHAAILKNSNLLAILVHEDNGNMKLQTRLEADTPEAATQIETVIRGMIAFGTLGTAENPDIARLLQTITINRIDEVLELDVQYPSVDLFDVIMNHGNIKINLDLENEDIDSSGMED